MSSPGRESGDQDVVLRPPQLPRGPWIYRKMIREPARSVPNGAYLGLRDRNGRLLARGIFNRKSTIAFRVLGGPQAPEDPGELFRARLEEAHALRTHTLRLLKSTDAYRLVNGEGDGLSGLVVDVFGEVGVVSLYSRGFVLHAEALERALLELKGIERVLFQADKRTQELEGFRLPAPPEADSVLITENGVKFAVTPGSGHKTGFFLDQRENRLLVGRLARGRRTLDLCTNTGGFALNAVIRGKCRGVTAVDLDERVLEQARANAKLNRANVEFQHADIFPWLRGQLAAGKTWNLVILDPAKLATDRGQKGKALRTYREMNTLAMQAAADSGLLFTCSCTGIVSEQEFLDVLTQAASAAGRTAQVLEIRGAGPDHPVALDFPEGRYLKGVLLRIR